MFRFSIGIILSMVANLSFSTECEEIRYAFDVGSGAVKTSALLVNKCTNEIVKSLDEHNFHLKYQSCIKDKYLDSQCFEKTNKMFDEFSKIYSTNCKKSKCSGIATAWARKAVNAKDLLKIYEEQGVKIKVLTQKQEGEYGYHTAYTHPDADAAKGEALVWDIGGGSFQLTTKHNENFHVYRGLYGVESYDSLLRSQISFDTYLSEDQINFAVRSFATEFRKRLDKDGVIMPKFRSKKIKKVYAIGRPMYMGIKKDLNLDAIVSKQDVYKAALSFSGKTPQQMLEMYPLIPNHYVNQAQSALVLVYSVMQELGVDEIHILDAKATDYVAVNSELWN